MPSCTLRVIARTRAFKLHGSRLVRFTAEERSMEERGGEETWGTWGDVRRRVEGRGDVRRGEVRRGDEGRCEGAHENNRTQYA
eukprot:1191938-Prorocentrum_minimum.AAC.7